MARTLLVFISAILLSTHVFAEVHVGQLLGRVSPGGELILEGSNLTERPRADYTASLRAGQNYDVEILRVEPTRLVLRAPGNLAPGSYLVHVGVGSEAPRFVGQVEITHAAPHIHRIVAISGWRKLFWHGQFDFRIIGERLCIDTLRQDPSCASGLTPPPGNVTKDSHGETMRLFLGSEPLVIGRCVEALFEGDGSKNGQQPARNASGSAANTPSSNQSGGQQPSEGRLSPDTIRLKRVTKVCYLPDTPEALTIHGLDVSDKGGPHAMKIEVAGLQSNLTTLRVSRATPRFIKWISLAVLAALLLPLSAIGTSLSSAVAEGQRSSLLAWILLDSETNTYSLSKFQLLLWTVVIVYGYVYLLLAKVLVQGILNFPPLPENFAVLLGGAGGTSLVASMLSRTRGPKGAGGPTPAISDLVSSGGALAADRAQFLIWTLIGGGGFIFLMLREPTERIAALPSIPEDLLGAMGVSALVYVLGKSVRLPGPVITQVTSTPGTTSFLLKIEGVNLHKDASISIDRQQVEVIERAAPTAMENQVTPGLSSVLIVGIAPGGPWTTGDHLLRVTNLDGQYAEVSFATNAPQIKSVTPASVTSGNTSVEITLTGQDLRPGSRVEWLAPTKTQATVIDSANTKFESETTVKVTLVPGEDKGTGTLTLVSSRGVRASAQISVV